MTAAPVPAAPLDVVLVDGSRGQRRFLRSAVEAGAGFIVVGEARNGREAVALVARLRPAAVLMELDLPVMSGIEVIERIMAASPTPIVVCSAFRDGTASPAALEALAAGAVDVLARPGPDDDDLDAYADLLRGRLRVAARVRVITHPRGRLRIQSPGAPASAARSSLARGPAAPGLALAAPRTGAAGRRGSAWLAQETWTADPRGCRSAAGAPPALTARTGIRLIAIGASTGGPPALLTVLSQLPADLAQAVLVVQHMAESFIAGLAGWLDELVALPVVVGASGRRLAPGTITIAPSAGNLLVQDDRLRVLNLPPEPGQFHVPGIDQSFRSIAAVLGPDAVGVLLTGMGRDGASGLHRMRERGALTLGQDEATSVVYGMPAAAFSLGAVDYQLPVTGIAPALLQAVGR